MEQFGSLIPRKLHRTAKSLSASLFVEGGNGKATHKFTSTGGLKGQQEVIAQGPGTSTRISRREGKISRTR